MMKLILPKFEVIWLSTRHLKFALPMFLGTFAYLPACTATKLEHDHSMAKSS